jgi:serine/threonine protein kinase
VSGMKKKYVIGPLLVLFLIVGFFFFKGMIKKNIIVLKDGKVISADETWAVGEKIFYKNIDRIEFVAGKDVEDIQVKYHLARPKGYTSEFFSKITHQGINYTYWIKTAGTATIGAFFCIGIFFLSRRFVQPHKIKREADTNVTEPRAEEEYFGLEVVVAFFLNIFKCQTGQPKETTARLKPVGIPSPDGHCIYELRLNTGDEGDTRRMTIGTLGEKSSRSMAYYVIYDEHLVVKIPATPITEFHQYAELIRKDRIIAEKLAPKECPVPGVAVILKKVRPFPDEPDLPPEILEKKYVQLLESNSEYQKYLKIGDTFAYFMDFSKYFFLSHIMGKMQDPLTRIAESISAYPNIIWDPVEFEAKYGSKNAQIYDRLQPVYAAFENNVRAVLQRNHVEFSIQEFQLKNWFLRCLSGGGFAAPKLDVKAEIDAELNDLAKKHFLVTEGPVKAFRTMIKSQLTDRNLMRHKAQITSVITNMLDLLAWLKIKKVAIRDLKPDNLLVAGDPARFPEFLESASQYSIGLIDVETAVSYETAGEQEIDQPQVGGTPSYATPSHLFTNEMIGFVFQDLPMTFCLQDWYAVVGIIYHVVTGDRLFDQAARTMLKLRSEIPKGFEENREPAIILEEASLMYWKIAVAEFEKKIQQKEKSLKYISLVVTADSKKMLIDTISKAQKRLIKSAKNIIESQTVFTGDTLKKSLLSASFSKISQVKAGYQSKKATPNLQPEQRKQALFVLEELAHLKEQSAHFASALNLLNKSVPEISSYNLLTVMFNLVLIHMHQEPWGTIASSTPSP